MKQIYSLLERNSASISITYISSQSNVDADTASRIIHNQSTEWSLSDRAFHFIKPFLGQCNFDMFASHLNNKFQKFCSWIPCPGASEIDAFTQDWKRYHVYAFPPFRLILKCLCHIELCKASNVMMVVPYHPHQPWFPYMLNILKDVIIILPHKITRELHLPLIHNSKYPLQKTRLLLISLSSDSCDREALQQKCQQRVYPNGERVHKNNILGELRSGSYLTLNGTPIPTFLIPAKSLPF